jgi:diguanylate cyclase (GGDEF)-like protein
MHGHIDVLESIAAQVGSRIGMLRVMAATTIQAASDPLTGLLNRRSFEDQTRELLHRGVSLCFAMVDLDHFKLLNDTHGHDAGDRALRLFARTMRSVLRADDLVCRYGGEEFAVVFPDRTVEQAAGALRRLQEELVVALAAGTVPGFTASFGLAHSSDAPSLEDLCRIADSALFQAKRLGRDRIVIDAAAQSTLYDSVARERASNAIDS